MALRTPRTFGTTSTVVLTAIRRTNSTSPSGPRQRTQTASISTRPRRFGASTNRACASMPDLSVQCAISLGSASGRRSHSKLNCVVRRTLAWAMVAVIAPVSPICRLSGEVTRRTSRRSGNAAAASPANTTSITSPYASENSQSVGL